MQTETRERKYASRIHLGPKVPRYYPSETEPSEVFFVKVAKKTSHSSART